MKLLRLHQWIKNFIVLLPLFFAGEIMVSNKLAHVVLAVLAFSLVASAVYVFNDWLDVEEDRKHPVKSKRPIASGQIGKGVALVVAGTCAFAGLMLAAWIQSTFLYILMGYLGLNICYTLGLKNIPVLDVSLVGLSFVARIFAGGAAGDVMISKWIVLLSFLLALFLALAKRRDDLLLFQSGGDVTRKVISGYNLSFISSAITLMGAVVVVAYIMYTVSPDVLQRTHEDYLYLTSGFVIIGILKYLQLTLVENKSGDPVKLLLRNAFMQLVVAGWLIASGIILYM
ncbi:MAG: UbiA prenyltransferase family protein [Flavobacteriales bacterium]|nr:UbiA prenyltransferase family protein [Flavobacteriales bacterium]